LPEIVRALKTFSARGINARRGTPGASVWQRGYYERIIKNERELNLTRQYMTNNPRNWQTDHENTNPPPLNPITSVGSGFKPAQNEPLGMPDPPCGPDRFVSQPPATEPIPYTPKRSNVFLTSRRYPPPK
jgi:hypothetical protein